MKYLADILTLTRFILGIVLVGLAISNGTPEAAFIVFLTAELTDTFDGTCARKWPFPKGKEPKYRKYAAKYDMVSDVLLAPLIFDAPINTCEPIFLAYEICLNQIQNSRHLRENKDLMSILLEFWEKFIKQNEFP